MRLQILILMGRNTSNIGHLITASCSHRLLINDERFLVLDKMDLIILATLAKNCRSSFSGIGIDSQVGLTSKSVKARVKKMMYHDVIEKFVVRVNPSTFGFKIAILLIKTSNIITKDNVIKRIKSFGDFVYHVYLMGRTCVTALIIEKPLDDVTIQSIKQHLLPASIMNISILNGDSA